MYMHIYIHMSEQYVPIVYTFECKVIWNMEFNDFLSKQKDHIIIILSGVLDIDKPMMFKH